jgi:hypothetical protein
VQKGREVAGRTQTINSMKQIGLACHNCNDQHGRLPPMFRSATSPSKFASGATGTVFFFLMPYLEQDTNFTLADTGAGPGTDPYGSNLYKEPIKAFQSPLDYSAGGIAGTVNITAATTSNPWGASSFAANAIVFANYTWTIKKPAAGAAAMGQLDITDITNFSGLDGNARFPLKFKDGVSNTVIFATRLSTCNNTAAAVEGGTVWAGMPGTNFAYIWHMPMFATEAPVVSPELAPDENNCNYKAAHALSHGGTIVCMGDGSVRNVSPRIQSIVWTAVCTPDSTDFIPADW